MVTMITMPKLGLTMTEGTVQEWKKNEGNPVEKGEIILIVATDKLTYEVEAPESGELLKIAVQAGKTVPVGAVLGAIGEAGETVDIPGGAEEEVHPVSQSIEKPLEEAPAAGKAAEKPVLAALPAGTKSIVVIGGGPGGYVAAIRAAQLGGKVTLVEKNRVGGTCVNVGCIPTKALLHAAETLESIRSAPGLGIDAGPCSVDWARIQEYKNQVVAQLFEGVKSLLTANGVALEEGAACFVDERTVEVTSAQGVNRLSPDAFIIASGSEPSLPPIPGIDLEGVVTSTEALSFDRIPESIAIIGGGVIGVEMASIYNSFGSSVTVIEMLPRILPGTDGEAATILGKILESKGIIIHTAARVESIEKGSKGLAVKVTLSGEGLSVEAEKVLVAVGRRPYTGCLNLEAAGVGTERGRIVVDSRMRTNRENIYAVGDCCSPVMLAHVAMKEGETAAENIFGRTSSVDYRTNPGCVYTSPELAWAGLTEEEARKQGKDVVTGTFPMIGNAKSLIAGETRGMVKIVAEKKYGEILGVHIVSPRATDFIAEASMAIRLEATLDEMATIIHGHPTFSESIGEAVLAAFGRTLHMPPV